MRILIADDEPIARARLRRMVEAIDGASVAGEASNGAEAIEMAGELAPDLVLLDVDMPSLDGLAAAEQIDAAVVFTTAHPQYALDAFELDAHDYLLKPVARQRLERAIAKVRGTRSALPLEPTAEAWRLIVGDGTLKRFVDVREVDSFVADEKYVALRWREHELLIRESLDALEQRLAPFGFVRANRGVLVRKGAIEAWDSEGGGTLVLAGGERVPVSRRAARAVRAALGLEG